MKNILYILFVMLLFSCKSKVKTFSFQGTWSNSTTRTQFVLKLLQTDTVLIGNHYAVQLAGNRIDSSLDDADITINGIVNITLEEATVTFTSGYSGTSGTAKITKHSPTEIKWEIIQKPTGEYYIPNVAILREE